MKAVKGKIRVALVGCGRISKNHLSAIKEFQEDLELVALCDSNASRLSELKKEYPKLSFFNELSVLLEKESVDLLVVTTPSGLHPEHTMLGAQKGVHILCEKPMATSLEDALQMIQVCEKNNVQLFVVKQNRKNPTVQLLKKAVEENRFGKIYLLNSNVFWTRPQEYFDMAPWRGTYKLDGGVFFNQASHYVDLLTWIFGKPEKVHAFYKTFERKIETEDSGIWNLQWKEGPIGSLNVTMLTYPKNLEGSLTVLGEKGSVVLGGVAVNEILKWDFADEKDSEAELKKASYETTSVYGFGHTLYYDGVIKTLRGQKDSEVSGYSALDSLRLLVAAQKSARENKVVTL